MFKAKLCEQMEQYDEMVEHMKQHVAEVSDSSTFSLSPEERNLLSVAYKNVVDARRASLRAAFLNVQKEQEKGSDKVGLVKAKKLKVEEEIDMICNDIIYLIDRQLLPMALSRAETESLVLYGKMKADYHFYMAEFRDDEERAEERGTLVSKAEAAYKEATEWASELAPYNPIRLGLALNLSVFLYQAQEKTKEACALAKCSFDDAICEIDNLDEDNASYKESMLILHLLKENLIRWTDEDGDEN